MELPPSNDWQTNRQCVPERIKDAIEEQIVEAIQPVCQANPVKRAARSTQENTDVETDMFQKNECDGGLASNLNL